MLTPLHLEMARRYPLLTLVIIVGGTFLAFVLYKMGVFQ